MEAFGLVVWSGACLQNFIQSKSTAARRERIETPCPFILFLFLAFRTLRQEGPHGFWLVSVLVMKTFALQRPAHCHKRLCLSLLFFLVKMLWRCVTYYKHTEWEIGEISWKTNFVFYMVLCLSLKHPQHFLQMYLQRGQPFKRNISC